MPLGQQAVAELSAAHEYFNRSTRNLTDYAVHGHVGRALAPVPASFASSSSARFRLLADG
jgi:hypothetical protein